MEEERVICLSMFKQLKETGLWGIELHSYCDNNEKRLLLNAFFKEIAIETGLNLTYGSDTHDIDSEKDMLGIFYGDFGGFMKDARC